MRGRGLKLTVESDGLGEKIAPHAGARIETLQVAAL